LSAVPHVPGSRPPLPRSRVVATLRALFRTRISAGLLVFLPIYVTYWIVRFVFEIMRDSSQWIVEAYLRSRLGEPLLLSWKVDLAAIERKLGHYPSASELVEQLPVWVQWGVSLLSVLLTIFILYVIGLFAANIVGRRAIDLLERLVDRVPFVKTVYRASKQIMTTVTGDQAQQFQRVAMFPFMGKGVFTLGFVTSVCRDPETGEEFVTIFYPTTPNPTTGYFLMTRRADVVELDWTVEEAVKVIMSGGLLMPSQIGVPARLLSAAPAARTEPGMSRTAVGSHASPG